MVEKIEEPANNTSMEDQKNPPLSAREEISDFARTAIIAVMLALIIRGFFFEPFNIPSASMKPTLLEGDYIFTNKYEYGYGQFSFSFFWNIHFPVPYEGRVLDGKEVQRGDILVFWLPQFRQNYIKRVVGLPGETIQMRQGRLYINDRLVPREPVGLRKVEDERRGSVTMTEYIETLPGGVIHNIYEESDGGPLDNTERVTIPAGHYFMMGDNRDNSQDSRVDTYVGPIPLENVIGRANVIFFSTDGSAKLWEVWKWPWSIRYNRLFDDVDPIRP